MTDFGRGVMPVWLFEALNELGVHETPGTEATDRIIEYHSTTTLKATSDEVAWCSSFVCWCFEKVGIRSTRSAAAISWGGWGFPLPEPCQGTVVVSLRGENPDRYHVSFCVEVGEDFVEVVGGNQKDSVSKMKIPKSKVKSYRWPWPLEESGQCR